MINTKIRAIGHPTESWQKEAMDMYVHRLKPYARLDLVNLPEGHQNSSRPDLTKTAKTEAMSLLKGLPKETWVVALDETGKEFNSLAFARHIHEWSESGRLVTFLIGGSWGLDTSVQNRADVVLSLGKFTLPHILARIVLVEQIYRAVMIDHGKTYHK